MRFSLIAEQRPRIALSRLKLAMPRRAIIPGLAALIVLGIWAAMIVEIRADCANALDEWTRNPTRAFQEHTLRTITAVDQDVKYLRDQYARDGRIDLIETARTGARVAMTRARQDTGLALALAKQPVELMGGTNGITSGAEKT